MSSPNLLNNNDSKKLFNDFTNEQIVENEMAEKNNTIIENHLSPQELLAVKFFSSKYFLIEKKTNDFLINSLKKKTNCYLKV